MCGLNVAGVTCYCEDQLRIVRSVFVFEIGRDLDDLVAISVGDSRVDFFRLDRRQHGGHRSFRRVRLPSPFATPQHRRRAPPGVFVRAVGRRDAQCATPGSLMPCFTGAAVAPEDKGSGPQEASATI